MIMYFLYSGKKTNYNQSYLDIRVRTDNVPIFKK